MHSRYQNRENKYEPILKIVTESLCKTIISDIVIPSIYIYDTFWIIKTIKVLYIATAQDFIRFLTYEHYKSHIFYQNPYDILYISWRDNLIGITILFGCCCIVLHTICMSSLKDEPTFFKVCLILCESLNSGGSFIKHPFPLR